MAEEKFKTKLMEPLDNVMKNPESHNLVSVAGIRSYYIDPEIIEAIMVKHIVSSKTNDKRVAKAFEEWETNLVLYSSELREKVR